MKYLSLFFLFVVILYACNSTKYVPDDKYLLNKVEIKNDTKAATADLETYLRQLPNNPLRLSIYNLSSDTTGWFNKQFRKLGQAPVIFSKSDTYTSALELKKELFNMGYLNAIVDTSTVAKDRKMKAIYNVKGGIPYTVREYEYQISDSTMARIMKKALEVYYVRPLIAPGDMFNSEQVDAEMERVAKVMRNVGYADFTKEYVYVKADTTLNSHQVDLFLDVYPSKDSVGYRRYKFNNVNIYSGYSSDQLSSSNKGGQVRMRHADTTNYRGLNIIRGRDNFLRNSAVFRNDFIRKGGYFSDYMISNTYESFSKMGAIKQVNISTTPIITDTANLMDVDIFLVPALKHWIQPSLDGTNSAGDIGISPSVSYKHQNLFNGSELLTVTLKGAYEFVGNSSKFDGKGSNYFEYGAKVGLKFPQILFPWVPTKFRNNPSATTDLTTGITYQKRSQYTRQFFNLGIGYNWKSRWNRLTNQLDLMNINYVRMQNVSDSFRVQYLENPDNQLIAETYKSQLIASTIYSGVWAQTDRFSKYNTGTTLRFSAEVAGALPHLLSELRRDKKPEGERTIVGVAYSEYFKLQGEFAQTQNFSKFHSIAYRMYVGYANPYGNSNVLPFEQRFFAGGPNGIRGWQTRRLGPGSFKPSKINGKEQTSFVSQTGDISLILSLEDRHKLTDLFSLALFVDAGNIWTVKNYQGQEGGLFKLDKFYKEIAMSYGFGLRLDMQFIIRIDFGIQLYDPSRDLGDRWVGPAWSRLTPQFGIGYPF